ncbi:MAG: hypothetical protein WDM90_10435 [Ferruginibacter sp.]
MLVTICDAQWYDPDKVNKKAGDIYAQANEAATAGNNVLSIKYLTDAIKTEPRFADAFLTRASLYASFKKYDSAAIDFETALQLDSVYSKSYLLSYSISLAGIGKFQQALDAVNKFLTIEKLNAQSIKSANYRKASYEFAVDYAKKHPSNGYVFAPQNLGDSINTAALEYFPSLTIDGKKTSIYQKAS